MRAPGGPHGLPGAFCFQGQGVLSGYPKYLVPLLENVNCQDSTPPLLDPSSSSYHEVFHIFVVAGSAAHYMMTFWYVAPFLLS